VTLTTEGGYHTVGDEEPRDISKEFEKPLDEPDQEDYVLYLYVAGQTPRSKRAIANIRKICEDQLKGHYDLEIIDVYQEPERAKSEQLFALPTLIKKLPSPLRRMIGDLSDSEKVLVGLNLRPKGH
jgi:circadian clock protein KaiB